MRRQDPFDPESAGHEPADWEQHSEASAWSAGIGRPAGIYWVTGRCVIVGYGTAAEAEIRSRGGVLVGTLRFGPSPYETRRAHRTVARIHPDRIVEGRVSSS